MKKNKKTNKGKQDEEKFSIKQKALLMFSFLFWILSIIVGGWAIIAGKPLIALGFIAAFGLLTIIVNVYYKWFYLK